MTKTRDGGTNYSENEEQEECFFYDSLDRIAASSSATALPSCCSSPAGVSDSDEEIRYFIDSPNDSVFLAPKFPMTSVCKYDAWISAPVTSVEERRSVLLRSMGLYKDPSLSRVKPVFEFDYREMAANGEFGRSDQLPNEHRLLVGNGRKCADNSNEHCNSSYSAESRRKNLQHFVTGANVDNSYNHNHKHNHAEVVKPRNSDIDGSPIANRASVTLPNRPSTRKLSEGIDDIQSHSHSNTLPRLENAGGDEEISEGLDDNDQMYTIKNLDTGKEFLVNEISENGIWNKIEEVGTGKQLTMEEFDTCVGHSPIVQELMRRQNVMEGIKENFDSSENGGNSSSGSKSKKKVSWFKSIKNAATNVKGHKDRRSSDDRDTSSEKGGRRSSSATDDSQDTSFHGPERVKVRQYGKTSKDLTALYKSQEIQAHNGSIWSIKFSLDGKYLASAGEDCVIHIWQVVESERKGDLLMEKHDDESFVVLFLANGVPEANTLSPNMDEYIDKKRRGRSSAGRKSISLDHVVVPETVFGLLDKPFCSFQGHLDDVLDLSWSKSHHLLSSSMDKTVRLWNLSTKSCLKVFSHGDYVTCIDFNPVDDRYFISGSLDAKVRIWSIPDHQVVDWCDLHEMVTAACYTPDGQAAIVGSYKGSCRLYNTSGHKLQPKSSINLQNKKKSHHKKITGFQFSAASSSEVFVTSADSRIRVIDGIDLVHKFKGFRNTSSQISSSLTANGRYLVSASEDSNVYVWKHEAESCHSRGKSVTTTRSYEYFHCQDVSAAIPWPGLTNICEIQDICSKDQNQEKENRISTTTKTHSSHVSIDLSDGSTQNKSAWGMVIVSAGLQGKITTFLNFGSPVQL